MWQYSQKWKVLKRNNIYVGNSEYSGKGDGKNNPQFEAVRNIGPIPAGHYKIGQSYTHPRKGPLVMSLTPVGHNARGRTGFLIHGESIRHPGDASEGCIILGPDLRRKIAESRDYDLEVTR